MVVRAGDNICRIAGLKGRKIVLSESLNRIDNDWWRIPEPQGIELMLGINGMTMRDIERVEFPCADDWYNDSAMMGPPTELSIDPGDVQMRIPVFVPAATGHLIDSTASVTSLTMVTTISQEKIFDPALHSG